MLVLALLGSDNSNAMIMVDGFPSYEGCADVREWMKVRPYYRDDNRVIYHLESATCVRSYDVAGT